MTVKEQIDHKGIDNYIQKEHLRKARGTPGAADLSKETKLKKYVSSDVNQNG